MKRRIGILLSLLLVWICVYASADTAINETHFPDENFREAVTEFDADGDGVLSDDELTSATIISCDNKSISSLKGVEYFSELTYLYCCNNRLTALDLSGNPALTVLWCFDNRLTALDVSRNPELTVLWCFDNQLTALDVSGNTALTELYCSDNRLTALDVSNNTALTELSCDSNRLTALDVSRNNALVRLTCRENNLTKLDITRVPAFEDLVKETEPTETDGALIRKKDTDGDGFIDLYLAVDAGVDVIVGRHPLSAGQENTGHQKSECR